MCQLVIRGKEEYSVHDRNTGGNVNKLILTAATRGDHKVSKIYFTCAAKTCLSGKTVSHINERSFLDILCILHMFFLDGTKSCNS